MVEAARTALLQSLRALPRGAGPGALRGLTDLLEAAVDADDDVDLCFRDELIRILGPVMGEDTPVTVEDAAACAMGVEAKVLVATLPALRAVLAEVRGLKVCFTREAVGVLSRAEALLQEAPVLRTREELEVALSALRVRLAAELSRLHAPVPVAVGDALPTARWLLGDGPPPRGSAVLELARGLDDFCRRAPLAGSDLEALRVLARRADAERETPGWPLLLERLRTLRPRLLPQKSLSPLYRSLAASETRISPAPVSLDALLSVR
ncbi:hypothetical protein [Corallococcus llansteffanensis]|uniref:Uncharacterized protein n=1 Tax=Corallococcus llansteffanensis TaxID=2316731 RepID=A0A3A8PYK3_9BACT|nr:hypothetical protein [Corallococcus llansteffanensis]RKH61559.1 hypothetical protein D7V93_11570 [Corallococcus llansteffanensis]